MKRFFSRPDVRLLLLVITANTAVNVLDSLIEIYRDGVPVSLIVVAVHVIAFALWGLFIWQMDLLARLIEWGAYYREKVAREFGQRVSAEMSARIKAKKDEEYRIKQENGGW